VADPLDAQLEAGTPPWARLGRNVNGYFGETIDIRAVLEDSLAAARSSGWRREEIPLAAIPGRGRPLPKNSSAPGLIAFTRRATANHSALIRIYISAGIHGDEPAGPLAVRQLLRDNPWPACADLWLCPCLNPEGYFLNRREAADGTDLNRDYLNPRTPQIAGHIQWLEQQPLFDLCLCLHEDWESHGFYLYELNPDGRPSLAEQMIEAVAGVCPIDRSATIEGRSAQGGIVRPGADPTSRPQWPEAFYLITHKTRLSYTLEAPSDFPLPVRVASLVTAVTASMESFGTLCVGRAGE
jgi:murein peptide amidase A